MRGTKEVIVSSDSTGESYNAAVWDPSTASLLSTYRNASALGFRTLQLLGDSYLLAADATKPRLHAWPLNSQSTVPSLRLSTPGKVSALASTPDGSYLAAGINEKIYFWQLCTGRLLVTLSEHFLTITCITFNRDGASFASGGEDGLIFVWSLSEVVNGKKNPLYSFTVHSRSIKDLYFGHFGLRGRLCSASADCTAKIFDANVGKVLLNIPCDVPLMSVTMDITERRFFIGGANGKIMQVNLHDSPRGVQCYGGSSKEGECTALVGHVGSVVTLSVSTDCKTLLSGGTDGLVNIWDISGREIIKTIKHKGPIVSAFFAKSFENLRKSTLKPSLVAKPLQRTSDGSGKDDFLEVRHSNRNIDNILNSDSYLESNSGICSLVTDNSDKLAKAYAEIDKLKNINSAIYQYSVKHLFSRVDVV